MTAIRGMTGATIAALDTGWRMIVCEPGAAATPDEAERLEGWLPAPVPGTAEQAVHAAGRLDPAAASGLNDKDVWYRVDIVTQAPERLHFEGLTPSAEVFLDGAPALVSRSMFLGAGIACPHPGDHRLAIRFPALSGVLAAAKGPRPRWRPMMIAPGSLRLVRTTPLGHMPGWAPPVAVVGPWKPVTRARLDGPLAIASVRLGPRLDDGIATLDATVTFDRSPAAPVELLCAGHAHVLHPTGEATFAGRMIVEGARPWWPHSHGTPHLHDVALRVGDTLVDLGRTGFRSLRVDRGADGRGFSLVVNDEPVFCRGASWMPADPVSPATADPRPLLELARDAGMTMLRISGTMVPEAAAFHDICDELGILVWHDLPFANFDYPAGDPDFMALVDAETRHLLGRLEASPSLAVVCGGSEIAQQATMLGLTPEQAASPLFDDLIPHLVAECAPNAVHVPHSPSGGALPFVTDAGIAHYFGVGAYRRPMEDVRRANVRFAAECLAFANVPDPASLAAFGLTDPADPRWATAIPRDAGDSWDFEDVRDHYVRALYGVDPEALRRADPDRYLALGRAAPAELMEAVFAEWRRDGSPCGGGLVWFLNDIVRGAGWGVIDARGEPKTTFHALKRAFRPVHLGLTDEGLNGLGIHLVNETAGSRPVILSLACYGEGPHPLARAERRLELAPRSAESLAAFALLGRFFDMADAYRFGPAAHEATLARLTDAETGERVAEAAHVLPGRACTPRDIGLAARCIPAGDGFALTVSSARLARFVTIEDQDFRPADQGFCLAPGEQRRIPLSSRNGSGQPRGRVTALNSHPVTYGGVA
ncbi:glycoside hydrolase family 2 protein [Phreatobacter sp.]|uniref:glycoside hydrolase family 2 protein n=1 Tax=Phreatobacter sp. TaxID=1966341 RepID=UPI003F7177CA